ncbi:hypothetical protein [uncultured Cohaesibacter sp.]|uniref:hypothetical protein n=1 Tax=uncultured Cohaesibacter sp. TaxID=1002546 RepID=UPI0029C893CB|nr:hypothetical protein [uncultured Cohaesibacter sp.]
MAEEHVTCPKCGTKINKKNLGRHIKKAHAAKWIEARRQHIAMKRRGYLASENTVQFTTTICNLCQKSIRSSFFEDHMREEHPAEYMAQRKRATSYLIDHLVELAPEQRKKSTSQKKKTPRERMADLNRQVVQKESDRRKVQNDKAKSRLRDTIAQSRARLAALPLAEAQQYEICDHCGVIVSKKKYKKHVRNVHSVGSSEPETKSINDAIKDKLYVLCPECNEPIQKGKLQAHRSTAHGIAPSSAQEKAEPPHNRFRTAREREAYFRQKLWPDSRPSEDAMDRPRNVQAGAYGLGKSRRH